MDWLNNVSQEAWAVITGLLATYGSTFIAWLITYVKMKIKTINLTKTIEEMTEICSAKMLESTENLKEIIDKRLDNIEQKIILKVNDNEDERRKQIDMAASDFEDALKELKSDTAVVEDTTKEKEM